DLPRRRPRRDARADARRPVRADDAVLSVPRAPRRAAPADQVVHPLREADPPLDPRRRAALAALARRSGQGPPEGPGDGDASPPPATVGFFRLRLRGGGVRA